MFFLGDAHGNLNYFKMIAKQNHLKDINVIQVGDFGVGFPGTPPDSFEFCNNYFRENNIMMYVVRGNHDNPRYFSGEDDLSNIKFLPDYTVLELEGKKLLCLGGGVSIDRMPRVHSRSWWPNEVFVYDYDKLTKHNNIDIVVSHSAPMFAKPAGITAPIVLAYAKEDLNLMRDLEKERNDLSLAFDVLKTSNNITDWIYGHFHASHLSEKDAVTFRALNINEIYEFKTEE